MHLIEHGDAHQGENLQYGLGRSEPVARPQNTNPTYPGDDIFMEKLHLAFTPPFWLRYKSSQRSRREKKPPQSTASAGLAVISPLWCHK